MKSRELHAKNPLAQAIQEAEQFGVNALEIEYKDGYEEMYFRKGSMAFGFRNFESSSQEAQELRDALYDLKKIRNVKISGQAYTIKIKIMKNFGEDMFQVAFQKVSPDKR